jgi:hypothetical protein
MQTGPMVVSGGVCVRQDCGVWSQAVSFVLLRFSRHEDFFTFNLVYKEIL